MHGHGTSPMHLTTTKSIDPLPLLLIQLRIYRFGRAQEEIAMIRIPQVRRTLGPV